MVILRGVEVCVKVEDRRLLEYDDKCPDQSGINRPACDYFVSKYVEARAGEQFVIEMGAQNNAQLEAPFNGLKYEVFIDGVRVDRKLGDGFPHTKQASRAKKYMGQHGLASASPFVFARVNTESDVEAPQEIVDEYRLMFDQVGTIQVKVFRVVRVTRNNDTSKGARDDGAAFAYREISVPSEALAPKENPLRTKLGPSKASERSSKTWIALRADRADRPFLVFHLHYRTRDALEKLLIIDGPSKSTVKEESATTDARMKPEEEDGMNADELRAECRRLQRQISRSSTATMVGDWGVIDSARIEMEVIDEEAVGDTRVKFEGTAESPVNDRYAYINGDELRAEYRQLRSQIPRSSTATMLGDGALADKTRVVSEATDEGVVKREHDNMDEDELRSPAARSSSSATILGDVDAPNKTHDEEGSQTYGS